MNKHYYPLANLSNGLRVANFSSAHDFRFVDGSVLPACSAERCTWLSMDPVEIVHASPCGRWQDIEISFDLSAQCLAQLLIMEEDPDVDVILVPRVVKEALFAYEANAANPHMFNKVRTIRVSDRVKKLNYIDRFCL